MESKEWIRMFKIALIENNMAQIETLRGCMPPFFKLNELQTAHALIAQAITLFKQKRDKVAQNMDEVKKIISFNKSCSNNQFGRFNESY